MAFCFGLAKIRRYILFHIVYNKGITRENLGEYPKSLNNLFLALSLKPQSLKTYKAIARVNRKNKTYLNGIDFCNKAIYRFPDKDELYAIKADIQRKIKNYDEAIKSYSQAINYNSLNPEYYVISAKMKYLLNDVQGAINTCSLGINNISNNAELYKLRAFYNLDKGNYESAEKDYLSACKLTKDNPHIIYMLASVQKLMNKVDEAEQNYNLASKYGLVR